MDASFFLLFLTCAATVWSCKVSSDILPFLCVLSFPLSSSSISFVAADTPYLHLHKIGTDLKTAGRVLKLDRPSPTYVLCVNHIPASLSLPFHFNSRPLRVYAMPIAPLFLFFYFNLGYL